MYKWLYFDKFVTSIKELISTSTLQAMNSFTSLSLNQQADLCSALPPSPSGMTSWQLLLKIELNKIRNNN